MGQKVNPIGLRLGIVKEWQSTWFASGAKDYRTNLQEDLSIRRRVSDYYPRDASIARLEIERSSNELAVTVHTARPGIVIGTKGQRVEELREQLSKLVGRRIRVNIREIARPELNANLVARNVADQIERRVSYRRAMKQTISRTMQAGAMGIKISCAGRLGGAEIARRDKDRTGRVPLHTLRADIDFATAEAHTPQGRIGVKVWIYTGDVVPEYKAATEEAPTPVEASAPTEVEEERVATAEASEVPEGS